MKIHLVGAELLHTKDKHLDMQAGRRGAGRQADRRTDRQRVRHDEANSCFLQFFEHSLKHCLR
jgi:hypothetical protein